MAAAGAVCFAASWWLLAPAAFGCALDSALERALGWLDFEAAALGLACSALPCAECDGACFGVADLGDADLLAGALGAAFDDELLAGEVLADEPLAVDAGLACGALAAPFDVASFEDESAGAGTFAATGIPIANVNAPATVNRAVQRNVNAGASDITAFLRGESTNRGYPRLSVIDDVDKTPNVLSFSCLHQHRGKIAAARGKARSFAAIPDPV
jgi:hypothetical protein